MEHGILDGRYELLEHIGGGGMADVYKAHDTILDRTVAVKLLHAQLAGDEDFLQKFQLEAKRAARLTHPNIVGIYDVGAEEDKHYIVMEYVAGETLKKRIQTEGRLSVQESLRIAKEIARALQTAHANNLVHCDIKPHNILMTPEGHVKVADFGIARAVTSSTVTYNGNVVGSVHYFSPEQAKGTKITPKSDVYSLGIVLYEMLTGELPFTGETSVGIALKHLQEEPRPICQWDDTLPPIVEAIVQKAMAKEPSERPDSSALIEDIEQAELYLGFGRGQDTGEFDPFATRLMPRVREEERPEPEEAPRRKFGLRAKLLALLGAAVLFVAFAAGAFLAFGKFWSSADVEVPDVKGKPMALAKQVLETANLRVKVAEQFDERVPAGQVISQTPEAGAMVKEKRVINLSVSKGGEDMRLPDLKGLSRLSAEDRLKKMGLKVGSVYEKVSDQEAWTVLEQEPPVGSRVTKGQKIDLTVSKGRPIRLVSVPNFQGGTMDAAKDRLKQTKLSLGSVTEEESAKTPGTVLGQTPSAGTDVDEWTTVDFVVAVPRRAAPKPTPVTPEKPEKPESPEKKDEPGKRDEGNIRGPSRTNETGKR